MPQFHITAPDGTQYEVTGPDGSTEHDALAQVMAQHDNAGPQPSMLQTLAASPVGRLAHDAVIAPIEGVASLLSKIDPTGGAVAPANRAMEGSYNDALAAQRNRPGYAKARQEADAQLSQGGGSGLSDQLIKSLAPSLAGLAGFVKGGLNSSNASADAQTAAQGEYAAANPKTSTAAQIAGGFMAGPEGGPAALPAAAVKQVPPSLAQLNAAKNAAYKVVDNSSMQISGAEVGKLHADLTTQLARMGLTDKTMGNLTPKVATAMSALEDAAKSHQTLQGMDIQRRIAGIAAGSPDKTERAAARIVQDGIDNFITNLHPGQLHGPVDQTAIDALPQARDLASRSFKTEQLQNIIDKAKNNSTGFAQSGYENALRSGFRKLLNNERGIKRFSPEERAAIKQVATGGSGVSATNLLRQVGKLSPQGALPMVLELGAVGALGPGALAAPAAGLTGRAGATFLQNMAAKKAVNLAALGKTSVRPANAAMLQLPKMLPNSPIPYGLLISSLMAKQSQ